MKYFKILFLLMAVILSAKKSYAQVKTNARETGHAFYRRVLKLDSVGAGKILEIQRGYKRQIEAVITDTDLTGEGKTGKLKTLIDRRKKETDSIIVIHQQLLATNFKPVQRDKSKNQ